MDTESPLLPRRVSVAAWASFVSQVVIVMTGGIVRLTSSGLGCDQWPQCSPGEWTTTPELGIHGFIEFGNRTLTFVLVVIAILTFLVMWRVRPVRRDLRWLASIPILGIVVQAVVGGIAVRTGLVWWIVGIHFVLSSVLVACTALMVERVYHGPGPRSRIAPTWLTVLARSTVGWAFVVVLFGIVATGAGPHAGDATTARSGLSILGTYRVHAASAYVLVALTLAVLVAATMLQRMEDGQDVSALLRAVYLLVGVELLQVGVGIVQASIGVPAVLVNIHMVLAVLLVAAATVMGSRTHGSIARVGIPAKS